MRWWGGVSRALRARAGAGKRLPRRGDGGHGPKEEVYNEPGGLLFGEEPLKPGEKRKWEDWELPYYTFLVGGGILYVIGLVSKPGPEIEQWAREEVIIRHKKLAEEQKAEREAKAAAAALTLAEEN